jgi:hypothetical protein
LGRTGRQTHAAYFLWVAAQPAESPRPLRGEQSCDAASIFGIVNTCLVVAGGRIIRSGRAKLLLSRGSLR